MIVWRPFMCQMGEIGETRSILGTRRPIRQWMAGTAERTCAKFTRKTCLVPRSGHFECQGQRSRSIGIKKTRCTLTTPPRCGRNGTPSLHITVAQTAGAIIRSLQRGVFAGMRAMGLAGYTLWAVLRISIVCL